MLRIFEPEREKGTRGPKNLHNEFFDLYTPNIIWMINHAGWDVAKRNA
jgi:hypothetical protein